MKRILIANRSEIALRIIRTLRMMEIESVAVYTPEDRDALHVQAADHAVCISSYLNQNDVVSAALITHCDAVHPGYGFLAENGDFARLCTENGLLFIGQSAELIELLGNKTSARTVMKQLDIPLVPGSEEQFEDPSAVLSCANEIGFPVMIKASAGGGGKGMRRCEKAEDFPAGYELAKAEARQAFGDDTVFLEKYIPASRHIEIQILADRHENVVTFPARNCSMQRKRQKVIEETPAFISKELSHKLAQDCRKIVHEIGFIGAGTAEFIVDENEEYYFLEINTRIQVEHGITEMISRTDLIEQQVRIAMDESICDNVQCQGYAIECRINAEDPEHGFMSSPGTITALHLPGGYGIRVDTALYQGWEVPASYDSLLAKIMAYGNTRTEAVMRMKTALAETVIEGVHTNLDFLYELISSDAFINNTYTTEYIGEVLHENRSEQ